MNTKPIGTPLNWNPEHLERKLLKSPDKRRPEVQHLINSLPQMSQVRNRPPHFPPDVPNRPQKDAHPPPMSPKDERANLSGETTGRPGR